MSISPAKILMPLVLASLVLISFQNCAGEIKDPEMAMLPSMMDNLENRRMQSLDIINRKCASCHMLPNAVAEPRVILDEDFLVSTQYIVPGKPDESPLFAALFTGMPKDAEPLTQEEVEGIEKWISYLGDKPKEPGLLSIEQLEPFFTGVVPVGQTLSFELLVKNTGNRAAQNVVGEMVIPPFKYRGIGVYPGLGGCHSVIPPASSCKIYLEYQPTMAGVYNQALKINYLDGTKEKTLVFGMIGGKVGPTK